MCGYSHFKEISNKIRNEYDDFKGFEVINYDKPTDEEKCYKPSLLTRYLIIDINDKTIEFGANMKKNLHEYKNIDDIYNLMYRGKWDSIIEGKLILPEQYFLDISPATKPIKRPYKLGKYNYKKDIVEPIGGIECDYDIATSGYDKAVRNEFMKYINSNVDVAIFNRLVIYKSDIKDPMEYLYLYEIYERDKPTNSVKVRSINVGSEKFGIKINTLRSNHIRGNGKFDFKIIDSTNGKFVVDARGDKVREKEHSE